MKFTGALFGPLMMAVAMALFAVNDAALKWLSVEGGLPLFQILLIRSLAITLIMLIVCTVSIGWRRLTLELRKPAYLLFGLAEVAVAFPYIYALKLLPLQTAQPIIKLNPLFAVLLGLLFFGQKSNWLRWIAIGLGLSGVLAIVDPFGGFAVSWLVLLPMLSALILGSRDAVTNRFGTRLNPFVVAFSMGWTMAVATSIAQAFNVDGTWQPLSVELIQVIALLCVVTPAAYVTRVLAIQRGEMSAIAPMVYTGMLWAMLFGVVIFGDPLGWGQVLGAAMIACGGLILIWFDRPRLAADAKP